MTEEKEVSEEPHLLLEVLDLSSIDPLLQIIEKHRDLSGVYLGKPVEEVDEKFTSLSSGLSKLKTRTHIVLKVKTHEVLEKLDEVARELPNVEFVVIVSDLSILKSVKLERLGIGFEVLNPYPNISKLRELGVRYLVIPMALLRSRIAKEAEAKNIHIITLNVNSPENYIKSRNLKVYAVVSEKPTIKREAESLGI
ncbi:MAG: hypothetical protein QN229_04755 [Desulfurococcaceae archaeon TW002]